MTKPLFRIEKLWMNRWMVYSIFHGLQRQYAQGAFDMLCGLSGGSESFRLVKYETGGGNLKSLIEIDRHHTGEVNTNATPTEPADAGSEVKYPKCLTSIGRSGSGEARIGDHAGSEVKNGQ